MEKKHFFLLLLVAQNTSKTLILRMAVGGKGHFLYSAAVLATEGLKALSSSLWVLSTPGGDADDAFDEEEDEEEEGGGKGKGKRKRKRKLKLKLKLSLKQPKLRQRHGSKPKRHTLFKPKTTCKLKQTRKRKVKRLIWLESKRNSKLKSKQKPTHMPKPELKLKLKLKLKYLQVRSQIQH